MADAPIVVAGAGVGGLTAALCLAQKGRSLRLFERAAAIEEIGAGLQISPNAGRILDRLGLAPALAKVAIEPEALEIRRIADGETLVRIPLADAESRWGAPFRVFHRADLQKTLLDAARANGSIEIETNVRVGDFDEEDGIVSIRAFRAGVADDVEAAGLIGADGVRSAVRGVMVRQSGDAPAYAGWTAWRALVEARGLPRDLRLRETRLWLGPRAHVVHYPLRDASIVSVVVIVETPFIRLDETLDGATLFRETGLLRAHDNLLALFDAAQAWRRWPLYKRPPLTRWSRGAATLLGDAAHPMAPFLAQGAAQAIEDAEALGAACADGAPIAPAFRAYEAARVVRANKIQSASRKQAALLHASGLAATARDLALRAMGEKGVMARNSWIYRGGER